MSQPPKPTPSAARDKEHARHRYGIYDVAVHLIMIALLSYGGIDMYRVVFTDSVLDWCVDMVNAERIAIETGERMRTSWSIGPDGQIKSREAAINSCTKGETFDSIRWAGIVILIGLLSPSFITIAGAMRHRTKV